MCLRFLFPYEEHLSSRWYSGSCWNSKLSDDITAISLTRSSSHHSCTPSLSQSICHLSLSSLTYLLSLFCYCTLARISCLALWCFWRFISLVASFPEWNSWKRSLDVHVYAMMPRGLVILCRDLCQPLGTSYNILVSLGEMVATLLAYPTVL